MSWRENLQPASFRGVPFNVISSGGTFGRRTVLHQFPFRDIPYVEDMGRRAREIRVEAIILGADYMAARDALIEAAEQPGPAKLIHPTFGELTVSPTDAGVQIDETSEQGGMCRVSFSCVESGEARFPSAQPATQDLVELRSRDALQVTADSFVDRFNLDGLPSWAQALSFDRAQGFLDQVRGVMAPVATAAIGRGSVAAMIDALSPALGDTLRDAASFVAQAQQIVREVRVGLDVSTAVRVLGQLGSYGVGEPHLPSTTPTRTREAANRDALIETMRATVAIERTRAVVGLEYRDLREAEKARDSVAAQIDQVADGTLDDRLFEALTALRAAVVSDIGARGANLARVVTITPASTQPALVLAYELYQDATRDQEIVDRNRILHPGFTAARQALEVPTDV